MAISREKKQEMVADYIEKMSQSQAIILTDYRGLSVANITELRRRLRESDATFQVIKNTLFTHALQESDIPVPEDHLIGPVAAGYCLADAPPVAKTLVDFAKETQVLKIRGAILGQKFIDEAAVRDLADLPPREVLLAHLVGAVQGPMSSLVSTLMAPMRELAQVLKARSEQGEGDPSPAEATA